MLKKKNEQDTPKKMIPKFSSEEEERKFWETHDSTEYINWSKAKFAEFPNLRQGTTPISIRLPNSLLQKIKKLANSKDVPYQSLIKMFLDDKVIEEMKLRKML